MKYLYKFLRTGLKSQHGYFHWEIGKWYKHEGRIEACHSGFHGSVRAVDALSYVQGEIIAKVGVRGDNIDQSDKQVWSEMKIIKAWHWTKQDSIALAVFAAETVIEIYEKEYPNDNRPRNAIEAAKAYLENPNKETARAAYADAYAAARAAAYAAARAADAAYAACAACAAAYAAARAACAAVSDKIEIWIKDRIKTLSAV